MPRGKMFAIRNFPLQSNSLCHFRYQVRPLLTRMLTQSQWGMPPRHSRKRKSRIFRGFRSRPSCPVAGARRRWFDGGGDRSPRPRRGEFSQFWRRETSVRSPARGEGPTLYGGSLPKPNWMGKIVQCGRLCGDDRPSRSYWVRPTVTPSSRAEFRNSPLRREAITRVETSMVADLCGI